MGLDAEISETHKKHRMRYLEVEKNSTMNDYRKKYNRKILGISENMVKEFYGADYRKLYCTIELSDSVLTFLEIESGTHENSDECTYKLYKTLFSRSSLGITASMSEAFYKCLEQEKAHKSMLFNDEELKDILCLFKNLFKTKDTVYIRLRSKKSRVYKSYDVNDLTSISALRKTFTKSNFKSKEDLMYSLNLYNNLKYADGKSLFSLHTFAIDVDFSDLKKFNHTNAEEIIEILEKQEFNKSIPEPNILEFGNNLRLIYQVDKVYSTKNVKTLMTRIAKTVSQRLVDYGATAQPLTTYGRIIHSFNSRNNKEIKVMYTNAPLYTLSELKDSWLEPLPEWYPEWKANQSRKEIDKFKLDDCTVLNFGSDFKEKAVFAKYNLNRVNDFFKIQEYFDYECDGFKRFLCFQVRNHLILAGLDSEDSKKKMKEFNSLFKKPLMWNVIEQDTRNVERKQYFYRSETILEHTMITPDIELDLNLSAILSKTEYKRRENKRVKKIQKDKFRNDEGYTKTELKRRDEFIKIAELELQGLSLRAIAKELNKSQPTLSRKINKNYSNFNYSEIKEDIKSIKISNRA